MQEICLTASLAGGSMNFLFCALKSTNKLRKDGASSSVWKVVLSKSMSLEKKHKLSLTKGALRMQMNWMYGAKEPLLVLLFDSISHSLLLL